MAASGENPVRAFTSMSMPGIPVTSLPMRPAPTGSAYGQPLTVNQSDTMRWLE
jgi:hypothetical protein